jgi:putative hemolysin
MSARIPGVQPEAITAPVAPDALASDIARLPMANRLLDIGELAVYCCAAAQAPAVMDEIARLRELSFRQVGEGTGLAQDRDEFDAHYQQLFVWHRAKQQIVGAYRLGFGQPILRDHGVYGLYSRSLFDYSCALFDHIGPSLELGRSFVHPDHQGSSRPLRMLWGGIAALLDHHPEVQTLFGPVSISPSYSELGRALLLQAIQQHHMDAKLSELVRPLNPGKLQARMLPTRYTSVLAGLADPTALSRYLHGLGPGLGLPMLIKHYLDLQGRFAAFNVDAAFNNTLDGLVFVQVHNIPDKLRRKLKAG